MALITCPECGREISDKAVSCPGCGFPIIDYIRNLYEDETSMIECKNCGFANKKGEEYCAKCGKFIVDYAIAEKMLGFRDIRNRGNNIRSCPKCGSERIHAFVDTVQTSRGKTKTKYTANLNPLRPFTLVNKKEKIVSKPQYVSISKMQCDNCGKIFR